MKKILFLLILFCVFSTFVNAFEYQIIYGVNQDSFYLIYYDDANNLRIRRNLPNIGYADILAENSRGFYDQLNNIKYGSQNNQYYYITSDVFNEYYKNDLLFLNLLYTNGKNTLNGFLNYLYNDSNFNNSNYIQYNNYELFYNEDGLAVESKVNGIYKGLYDDIGQSGILYNSVGEVVLIDGVEPSFLTKQWLKLQNKVINPLLSVFSISNIWKNILCVVVILASLRMIIRYAFKAFLIRLYSKRIKHYENTITRIENA